MVFRLLIMNFITSLTLVCATERERRSQTVTSDVGSLTFVSVDLAHADCRNRQILRHADCESADIAGDLTNTRMTAFTIKT